MGLSAGLSQEWRLLFFLVIVFATSAIRCNEVWGQYQRDSSNTGRSPVNRTLWVQPAIAQSDVILTDNFRQAVLLISDNGTVSVLSAPVPASSTPILGIAGCVPDAGPSMGILLSSETAIALRDNNAYLCATDAPAALVFECGVNCRTVAVTVAPNDVSVLFVIAQQDTAAANFSLSAVHYQLSAGSAGVASETLWSLPLLLPTLSGPWPPHLTPVLSPSGAVVFIQSNGTLSAHSVLTGRLLWQSSIAAAAAGPYHLAATDTRLYVLTTAVSVTQSAASCALNAASGAVLWCVSLAAGTAAPVTVIHAPTLGPAGGTLFLAAGSVIYALSGDTGAVIWSSPLLAAAGVRTAAPLVLSQPDGAVSGAVYALGSDCVLRALHTATGTQLWQLTVDAPAPACDAATLAIGPTGALYAATNGNNATLRLTTVQQVFVNLTQLEATNGQLLLTGTNIPALFAAASSAECVFAIPAASDVFVAPTTATYRAASATVACDVPTVRRSDVQNVESVRASMQLSVTVSDIQYRSNALLLTVPTVPSSDLTVGQVIAIVLSAVVVAGSGAVVLALAVRTSRRLNQEQQILELYIRHGGRADLHLSTTQAHTYSRHRAAPENAETALPLRRSESHRRPSLTLSPSPSQQQTTAASTRGSEPSATAAAAATTQPSRPKSKSKLTPAQMPPAVVEHKAKKILMKSGSPVSLDDVCERACLFIIWFLLYLHRFFEYCILSSD